MTLQEVSMVLNVLRANYPIAFKNMTADEIVVMRNLWYSQLKHESVDKVNTAVQTHISLSKYMPTIAEVKGLLPKNGKVISMREDPELVERFRQMIIAFQDEWRNTGKLPSMSQYESKFGLCAELQPDGYTKLYWRKKE